MSAAILAGGQARRLGGGNKSALTVGTASILERQLAIPRAITPHILIVGGDPLRGQGVGGTGSTLHGLVVEAVEKEAVEKIDTRY